ncbi:MAG TPA: ATP-binding protein [Vicinamibacterales bacterium]|nr:ATP-binding protein [Vicinamibacterales bacterium]
MSRSWQRLYYLVVLVDLLAVGAGLYFAYRVTGMVEASIAANKASAFRREQYLELSRFASELDAPGSGVFASHDPAREERRLAEAQSVFQRALEAARRELADAPPGATRETMLRHLNDVQTAGADMVAEGHRLFDHYRRGELELAGQRMAAMDRHYADVHLGISNLRADAISSEMANLDVQAKEARSLQSAQGVIAAAILFMIGASGIYGHKLSTRAQAHLVEREGYIARLRENEETLERRVLERTEALRKAEERLRLAARAANDALWDWEIQTDTLWWNEAWETLFGYRSAAPTFAFWMSLVHPDDAERVAGALRQFLDSHGSEVWRAEYRLRRADGSYAWVLDRGYLVRCEDGTARRLIGAMMDITERKNAERMKSDFVSFVSHQLRTPLAGMNWMLELAADSDGVPATTCEYIAEARASGARLVTLVNDLLDIARLESGRAVAAPERVALGDLTRSVLQEMSALIAERRHTVQVQETCVTHAWVDAQLARQAITNLLSNAVKYTPAGGRIDISLRQQSGIVQWSVADSGVGIPRAAQARLFERFYRAENALAMEVEGTGLGLHLVRLVVEQAGGRVWCESEAGRGAEFSFTLPAAHEGAPV